MSARRNTVFAALTAALIAIPAASAANPAPETRSLASGDCFSARQWRGSSAASDNALYLRVGMKDVYRVDLHGGGARRLNQAGAFLVTRFRGADRVCAPIDLDLAVSDTMGFTVPLFPQAITRLTPEQAAAIPPELKP
jgi:hypothetical protein